MSLVFPILYSLNLHSALNPNVTTFRDNALNLIPPAALPGSGQQQKATQYCQINADHSTDTARGEGPSTQSTPLNSTGTGRHGHGQAVPGSRPCKLCILALI